MTGRGRGRPRAGEGGTDTRQRIVAAARTRFAAEGFDRASLRAIAADAGVDPSLIRHYFADKAGLLVATRRLPVDPVALLHALIEQGPDGLGCRVVDTFLTAWDPHREVFSGLIRTTMASGERSAGMLEVLREVILASLIEVMDGPDVALRAGLAASALIGMATLRYVLEVGPVATATPAQVTGWYGPVLQALITPSPA